MAWLVSPPPVRCRTNFYWMNADEPAIHTIRKKGVRTALELKKKKAARESG